MTGAVDIINSTLGKVGPNTENIVSWWSKYNIIDVGLSKRKSKLELVNGATSIMLVK